MRFHVLAGSIDKTGRSRAARLLTRRAAMLRFVAYVATLLAFATGCGAAVVIAPPGREDMSTGIAVGGPSSSSTPSGDVHIEQRLGAGVHAASLSKSGAFPFDVGAGYIYTRVGLDRPRSIHGGYFEFAPSI